MQPIAALMQQQDRVAETHKPQDNVNSLILNIKTEPDLLNIESFVYGDEHEDLSASKDGWDCESDSGDEYALEQCDDGRSMITIIKQEPSEEELSFCDELRSNCKPETIEISTSEEEEEECVVSLEESEEVNITGMSEKFKNLKLLQTAQFGLL
ncbi:hypothetical protein Baya_1487 [Bagarius yarrelli]|uniref:Uncharacterized protein n=1 Tax=Bagarius yarrelli TaxID=175774 RepID=A0A556TL89_BAGYA|nr:hypothetical protein Baya_1487 [Bagarius yarrelli]